MFTKPKKKLDAAPAIHSLLGKGMLWKGEIHCGKDSLRVEGTVEGTIHSDGEVVVAPTGLVNGIIHARHLIVTGRVEGVFRIEECLEIHGTGCVEGEVEVGSLVVDEGGILQGVCTRKGHERQVVTTSQFREKAHPAEDQPEATDTAEAPSHEPAEAPVSRTRRKTR